MLHSIVRSLECYHDIFFSYQQKYSSIIYYMKISTSGIVIYTTQHHTMHSYGDLIQALHQELGNHRSDHRLGTQTQYLYANSPCFTNPSLILLDQQWKGISNPFSRFLSQVQQKNVASSISLLTLRLSFEKTNLFLWGQTHHVREIHQMSHRCNLIPGKLLQNEC